MKEVQVAILAGGLGRRMGPLTETSQKCMLEFAGVPFLQHTLDHVVRAFGSARVVIATGYKGVQVTSYFGSRYRSLDLTYVQDDRPIQTKRRLLLAQDVLTGPFLFLAGDTVPPIIQMVKVAERFAQEPGVVGVVSGAIDHSPAPTHSLLTIIDGYVREIEYPPSSTWTHNQYREMHVAFYDTTLFQIAAASEQLFLTNVLKEVIHQNGALLGDEVCDGPWIHLAVPGDLLRQQDYLVAL